MSIQFRRFVLGIVFSASADGLNSHAALAPTDLLDSVVFRNAALESLHNVEANLAPLIKGGMGEPGRVWFRWRAV
ncbi:hypothetical protein P4E94_15215 [Pontiellaceae bacterium B12219]|nr:hypothetical protein [Pontiellaceae bacterium B12219]